MKVLNQEAIRRMISGGTSGAVAVSVGGGGDGTLTPAWVEGNYVSKSFFSQLFTIHGKKTVTDPQTGTTTEEDVEITPNQLIDDEYDVTDVEVKFGLWTQQFLTALGKNSSGGGGGDTLTEPLASINSAGLGTPTAAGQVITWNGSAWIFDIPQGGGGGGSVTSVGLTAPTGFTVNSSPITSAGTIQLGFATGYSLPTNAKQSNWDAAYSWGNHANAGYLTSSDIQDMATETWVGENYLPLAGGMITGPLRMGEEEAGSSPYIYWGDGSYVYIGEDADDHLTIRGRYGVNILTDTGYNLQWNNNTLATQTWVNDQGFVKSSGVTSVGMSVPTGLRVNSAASYTITGSGTFALSVQSGYFIPTTSQRTTWNGKQDAIADLSTIRRGAALGATAVQPSAIADMATKTWVENKGYLTSETYTGTVTSVGLTMPTGFSVSSSPVTSSGTLAVSFGGTITKNRVLASPNGSNGSPSWRALVASDIPDLSSIYLTSFTETDPTVPSWAKQSSKPSYAFNEITGSVAATQLPTMYWADVAISSQSNNNTSPQFGNLRLRPGSSNYGSYLRFGDGNYCYLYEDSDNHLKIYGSKGIELLNDNSYNIKLNDLFHVYKGGIAGSSLNFPDSTPFTSYTFYNILRSTTHTIDLFVKSTLNVANNSAIRWQNSSGNIITGMRLNNNNQFEIGYGMASFNYESRIYGGSTTGIKFYCGESNEVASVYRNTVNNVTYQGLRIGDALLSWDSTNDALKVQRYDGTAVNLCSLGSLSALGLSAGANGSISKLTITEELKFDNSDFSHTIYDDGSGILHINASEGLEIGSDLMIPYNMVVANEMKSSKFYLDSTRYIYLDGTTLKYYNGSQSKTIVLS